MATVHSTEVEFTSFPSGGYITAAIVNSPDEKLKNSTSVHSRISGLERHQEPKRLEQNSCTLAMIDIFLAHCPLEGKQSSRI